MPKTSRLPSLSVVEKLRAEFPLLSQTHEGKSLVYFDNAATLQRPQRMMDAEIRFYRDYNSNVHRSAHRLSCEATEAYELSRRDLANYIGVQDSHQVIWTRGATEAVNLLVASAARSQLQEGDEILVSRAEHHANFVPWQQIAKEKKCRLKIVELDEEMRLSPQKFEEALSPQTKWVALTALSNVTGAVTPLSEIVSLIKQKSQAFVCVDACQALLYHPQILKKIPAIDFMVGSAHKMGGPTGVGFLFGKRELLEVMPPYHFGGEMISVVYDEDSRWNAIPYRFEAGTPPIAQVIAWGELIRFWNSQNRDELNAHLSELTAYALDRLSNFSEIEILGPKSPENRHPIFSFSVAGIHPHDLGTFVDSHEVAIRGGHHCAQPLHRALGFGASSRASLTYYNTKEEWDRFELALKDALQFFKGRQK